mgnify:CR=1 FL=1
MQKSTRKKIKTPQQKAQEKASAEGPQDDNAQANDDVVDADFEEVKEEKSK